MGVRERERLCVEMSGVRRDWEQWCARRGLTAGEGVRHLIAAALDGSEVHSDSAAGEPLRWTVVGDPRARIEIRLTGAELEAVDQRAVASGLTSNRWIVALIRAQLMREPQFGELELRLLSDSNQHLATVGRWLAQLVRDGLAARPGRDGASDIGAVRQQIDRHLVAVAAVIRSNLDRWSR